MASRNLIIDKANELFDDVKRAVGPTKFRRFLLILIEVKRDGYDLVDTRHLITNIRGVIGHREDLIRRFMEFVNESTRGTVTEESRSTLRDASASNDGKESDRVRVALNFDDVDEMGQRQQSSEIPPHSKGKEPVGRTLPGAPEYIEKGKIQQRQQSEVPSCSRREEGGRVRKNLNFDVHENKEEEGKIQQRQQSKVPSCSRREEGGRVRKNLNFDVHENMKGKIQQRQQIFDHYLDSRGEDSRVGSNFDGNENREVKMTPRQPSENPLDSSVDKQEGVRIIMNYIRELLEEKENTKQCHQSVVEATPHGKEVKSSDREPEVRKLEYVYKVLQLNGDVLGILRDVLEIVDRRYSNRTNIGKESSAEILRLVNEVLDNVPKVYSEHNVKDFIDVSGEVLEKVIEMAEEPLIADETTSEVLLEEGFSNSCANKENDSSRISGEVNQLLEDVVQLVEKEFLETKKIIPAKCRSSCSGTVIIK